MSRGMRDAEQRMWPVVRAAHPVRLRSSVIEARLPDVRIGERCLIRESAGSPSIVGHAQVIGFSQDLATLALLGASHGLSRAVVVEPTGEPAYIHVGSWLLGSVVDCEGRVCNSLIEPDESATQSHAPSHGCEAGTGLPCVDLRDGDSGERREVEGQARRVEKRPVDVRLETGVRVIDGVLAVGVGQRVAVLAPAGAGKTSLLQMIAAQASADVAIIALIGERGREVSETVEHLRSTTAARHSIVVKATSDAPAVERVAAAASAMTIAEYFRDQGRHVLLVVDSLTRYARALREVALAAGELPARHGYPASVFERLPQLLERPGNAGAGAITAFFSVLVESDDEVDPIAQEVMSIVDGHFVLSARLAGEGRFPAIDLARSISRVSARVGHEGDEARAMSVRGMLARAAELALLVEMGEYREGTNPDDDDALAGATTLRQLFMQRFGDSTPMMHTRKAIDDALR